MVVLLNNAIIYIETIAIKLKKAIKSTPNGKTNHKNEVDQAVYTAYNILGYSV